MGTRSATGSFKLTVSGTAKNLLDNGKQASAASGGELANISFTSGVSANEISRVWEENDISISSGNSVDIDLYDMATRDVGAGAGLDGLGQALSIEEIAVLAIKQVSGSGRLEINATNPTGVIAWLGAQTVANGGALRANGIRLWAETGTNGLDLTDASSHVVRLGANGGDVVASITLLGRHDDDESSSSSSSSSSSQSSSSSSSVSSSSSLSSTSQSSSSSSSSP